MKNILTLIAIIGGTFGLQAQNVDLNNSTDYIRVQKYGELDFTRAFGLNSSNQMYIGSVEKTIGNIYFYNNGTGHLMTINPNGNVGIGTTNPEEKLHVNGTTTITGNIGTSSGAHWIVGNHTLELQNSDVGEVVLSFHRAGYSNAAIKHNSLGGLIFSGNGGHNANHMILNSNGSLGIGTTNPTKLLDVNGDAKIGNLSARKYLKISSSEWPEIRFQTPLSDEKIRLGVAHTDNSNYGVLEGDFYAYTSTVTAMPLIVRKNGDVSLAFKRGKVGIGTDNTGTHKLAVEGSIGAREIKVQLTGWSDFVFDNDYDLPPLNEVESHIKQKGHLKDIPSARDVAKNGIFLGEMDAKLLQKIEELTLYTIQQEKEIQTLKKQVQEIEVLIKKIRP